MGLFRLSGSWVTGTAHTGAKLLLDRHSSHHAWRAAQWWDRLPVLADVDRASLSRPEHDAAGQTLEALGGMEGTPARLAGLYRVALPRLLASYRSHAAAADGWADGSSLRTLERVSADLASDWQEGELLLQGMLTDGESVAAAAEAVARLENLLGGRGL
jgi:hypothetical protein